MTITLVVEYMTLEDLSDDVSTEYEALDDSVTIELDRQTKHELAMLSAALGTTELDDLIRRGVHVLFQGTVETGGLDFHLRQEYDLTYDEYLSGMTYDEMRGGSYAPPTEDDRRYQF